MTDHSSPVKADTPDELRRVAKWLEPGIDLAEPDLLGRAADEIEELREELESARAQVTIAKQSNGFQLLDGERSGIRAQSTPDAEQRLDEDMNLFNNARADAFEEAARHVEKTGLRNPDNIARDIRALALTLPEQSSLMRAAEKAQKTVESWSDAKQDYAERVVASPDVPAQQMPEPVAWRYKLPGENWRYTEEKPAPYHTSTSEALYNTPLQQTRNATIEECARLADGWLATHGDNEIQYTSAREYASDAVSDIADAIRTLAFTSPERRCEKCGEPTKSEEAWVDGKIWCHPCADAIQPQQTSEPRFFIDHGTIHDRVTGKHVTTDGEPPFEDGIEQVCELLNGLAHTRPDDPPQRMREAALPALLREINPELADVLTDNAAYVRVIRGNVIEECAKEAERWQGLKGAKLAAKIRDLSALTRPEDNTP